MLDDDNRMYNYLLMCYKWLTVDLLQLIFYWSAPAHIVFNSSFIVDIKMRLGETVDM